jgi:protein-tyrosine phosphatase
VYPADTGPSAPSPQDKAVHRSRQPEECGSGTAPKLLPIALGSVTTKAKGKSVETMVDIHYHLIFGVDDGPKDIEASLALAEASIAEGVTHIVCTPHANDHFAFLPELNQERLAMLNERLRQRVTLGLGCDFHLSYDNIEDALQNRTKYTINSKKYLLVEFPNMRIVHQISDIFCRFLSLGIIPIITHPERNPVLARDPDRMVEWIRSGCMIQVTASSLTGRFGKGAEAMSHELIKKNWVHFIASDAHSIDGRPPCMRQAHEIVKARYGESTADLLCIHNPRAAFMGENLPQQPEPIGILEGSTPPKRGFLRAMFGH